jgi:hypothetical protein
MRRLTEEWDGKKVVDSNAHPSWVVNFAQTNSQPSGTTMGGTSQPIPSAQPMNHFYSQTTIDGLTPTGGMPQHTTTSMFGQGYTHVTPNFSMPNFGSASYTPGGNCQTYTKTNNNYQATYTIVAYIDPISLPDSSAGFLLNYAYNNVTQYNTHSPPEYNGFGYETPLQFSFRPQPVEMTPARGTVEPYADPNNLTTQLASILRETFGIEPKGRCLSIKNLTLATMITLLP